MKGVKGGRQTRKKDLKLRKTREGKIYDNIADLMEEQQRLFYDDPDCVWRPSKVCKTLVCNGEEVKKGCPVIVKDIESSCFCAEWGWVARCQ